MTKFKIFFAVTLLVWVLSACGKGVMDDSADHSSNSQVKKNSLASPDPGNTMAAGSGTLNPYPADANSNSAAAGQNDFYVKAAQGGMAEVELGRLAQTKASNAAAKQFAAMMVNDHGKANDELKAVAQQKGVTLPTAVDAKHQAVMQRLQSLSGAEFDAAYADAMVQDHEETIALFEAKAQDSADQPGRDFAARTLPTLKHHLDEARKLQSSVKK
ncbi:MAG: DUF4142 domain-containing protein [Pyrinomonadaceae bacterium]